MTSFPRETFGTRLKRYRKFRKFTQTQLSREVRISQSYVCKIEKDELAPDVYVAVRMAGVLRFPLKGLVENP